jgi:PUB domain
VPYIVQGIPAVQSDMPLVNTQPSMNRICHKRNGSLPGPPSEELQSAAGLLYGEEQGAKAAALLSRVLNNIISKPSDEKYRWVRCSTPYSSLHAHPTACIHWAAMPESTCIVLGSM